MNQKENQANQKINLQIGVVALMVLIAAASRFFFIPNFSPLTAMGLFGATYFSRKWLAVALPIFALYASDLILNNVFYAEYYPTFTWFANWPSYVAFGLIIGLGFLLLRNRPFSTITTLLSTLGASLLFFLFTNFFVWYTPNSMYPATFEGLTACYVAGLPFLKNTLMGDVLFVTMMFGSYEWIKKQVLAVSR